MCITKITYRSKRSVIHEDLTLATVLQVCTSICPLYALAELCVECYQKAEMETFKELFEASMYIK